MKELPSAYSAKECEPKIRDIWQQKHVFVAHPESKKPHFSVIMPPPNVTGVLHMGHALGNTLQDILVRWKKMQGYDVLWVPGTDHAGIATQTVVEKHLLKVEGKRRHHYSREEFVDRIFQWKEKSQERIFEQLKALGCATDWNRLRFSLDDRCSKAVRVMFKRLFDLGLIYKGDYLVNWDPVTGTALADDEVEYEERQDFLWTLRYPIEGTDLSLSVATTRPETVLGDTAVAVHPNDERYKPLVGLSIRHPITHKLIPIIKDAYVDPEFGTGVVKITPAHDPNDYQIGLRHNLPMINILTKECLINEEGGPFQGLSTSAAREAVIQEFERQGNLVKKEPHIHRVGVSYRSKAIIEPMLSKQWYVKVSSIKQPLREYVESKQVCFFPSNWENEYFQWIDKLRDWCISRQLWWGHRIPIWYRKDNPDIMICYDGEGVPAEVQQSPDDWYQEEDVLDTWFSSGLWPFSTMGWPEKTVDLSTYFPNSTLITGNDILFFWVARMIMMSHFAFGKAPFHDVHLHGLIYSKSYWRKKEGESVSYVTNEERKAFDLSKEPIPKDVMSKWEKMSKSKGNVIDPMEVIHEYGADAMRFALASSPTDARHIDLDRRKFEESRNFMNKIWNGARFVLQHLSQETSLPQLSPQLLELEDTWILSRAHRAYDLLHKHLSQYEFDKASNIAYTFFWDDLCSWWIECSKPALFGKESAEKAANKKALAIRLLFDALKLLHPFAPFITEELFSYMKEAFPSLCVEDVLAETLFPADLPSSPTDEAAFERLKAVITQIRAIRGEMKLSLSSAIDLIVFSSEDSSLTKLIHAHERLIHTLVKTKSICYNHPQAERPSFGSSASIEDIELLIPLPQELHEQEKQRLQKELLKLETLYEKTKSQLAKPGFRDKAPSHVIEGLEKGLIQQEKDMAVLRAKL